MVRDRSEDFVNTWAFLDKRLEDIKQFAKMKENVSSLIQFKLFKVV